MMIDVLDMDVHFLKRLIDHFIKHNLRPYDADAPCDKFSAAECGRWMNRMDRMHAGSHLARLANSGWVIHREYEDNKQRWFLSPRAMIHREAIDERCKFVDLHTDEHKPTKRFPWENRKC